MPDRTAGGERPCRAGRHVVLLALWGLLTVAPAAGQQPAAVDPVATAARADASYLAGDFAQALVDYDQALAGGITDGHTLYRAGHCQKLTGKPIALVRQTMGRAIAELGKAVHLGQREAQLIDFDHLSSAYAVVGDLNGARQTAAAGIKAYGEGRFGDLAELEPIDAYHLGRLGATVGDADLQVLAYGRFVVSEQQASTSRPVLLGQALADVGVVHLSLRRFEKAEAALGMALETVPPTRLPGTRFAHAVALFRRGKYQEAGLAFEKVRLEDPLRESQAGYAVHAMRTLSQMDLLMDKTRPLPDLRAATPPDLEQMLLNIGSEMGQAGAELPRASLQRGYGDRKAKPEARAAMRRYRDLKVRLAYVAAEYAARGLEIREFAFTSGLQGGLMSWRHLPRRPGSSTPGEIPTHLLGPDQIAELEAKAAAARERREKKEARRQKAAAAQADAARTGDGDGKQGAGTAKDTAASDNDQGTEATSGGQDDDSGRP